MDQLLGSAVSWHLHRRMACEIEQMTKVGRRRMRRKPGAKSEQDRRQQPVILKFIPRWFKEVQHQNAACGEGHPPPRVDSVCSRWEIVWGPDARMGTHTSNSHSSYSLQEDMDLTCIVPTVARVLMVSLETLDNPIVRRPLHKFLWYIIRSHLRTDGAD